jgi:hypothetical protein
VVFFGDDPVGSAFFGRRLGRLFTIVLQNLMTCAASKAVRLVMVLLLVASSSSLGMHLIGAWNPPPPPLVREKGKTRLLLWLDLN